MFRRDIFAVAVASLFISVPSFAQQKLIPLKIGVTAGLHAQILEQVVPIAKKNGLEIKIIEFKDYVQPNAALAPGI